MIEKTILDYLLGRELTAYMERPEEPPQSYVLIEKTGSSEDDLIITSTIAIQSYAPTLYEAAALNEQVKRLMNEADTLSSVSASKLVSDYNFTSTASKQYRYQAVYEVTHKE